MTSERYLRVAPGRALRLDSRDGELVVVEGRVWLTLARIDEDRFLDTGARIRLHEGHGAVIEPASAHRPVVVRWALRPSFTARCVAAGLRWIARGFTALANHASARADLLH